MTIGCLPDENPQKDHQADRAEREKHDPHDEAPQERHAEPGIASVLENAFEDVRDEEVGHRDQHRWDAPLMAVATVNDPLNKSEAGKIAVQRGDHARDPRDDEAQHDDSSQ